MPPAARLLDNHVCPMVTGIVPHVGGPIVMGSVNVITVSMLQARVGDPLVCVGPPDVIVKGSTGVFVNGLPAARLGDMTAHGGVIVIGAPTVIIGEAGGGGGGGGGGAGGAGSSGQSSTAGSIADPKASIMTGTEGGYSNLRDDPSTPLTMSGAYPAPARQAKALIAASASGTPFCERCAAHAPVNVASAAPPPALVRPDPAATNAAAQAAAGAAQAAAAKVAAAGKAAGAAAADKAAAIKDKLEALADDAMALVSKTPVPKRILDKLTDLEKAAFARAIRELEDTPIIAAMNKAVFYSGKYGQEAAWKIAEARAKAGEFDSVNSLTQNLLNRPEFRDVLPDDAMGFIDDLASKKLAEGASGLINLIGDLDTIRENSVFRRIELPALLKNDAIAAASRQRLLKMKEFLDRKYGRK